jgi:MAF protein
MLQLLPIISFLTLRFLSMQLVLASTSTYRASLLSKLQLPFITDSPNIDEQPLLNEPVSDLVLRLAEQKAYALSKKYSNSLIIGSDQVATLNHENGTPILLTKPITIENAIKQLKICSGKSVEFLTGLALLNTKTRQIQSSVTPFKIYFRNLTSSQIKNYVEIEQPLDCSGSFKAEGLGICLFEKMEGTDPNALIGLPLIALTSMLKIEGISPI